MVREVMLGKHREPLPLNSVQQRNANHKKQVQTEAAKDAHSSPINIIPDNGEGTAAPPPKLRRSQRFLSQQEEHEEHLPNLHRIYDLAEHETAKPPPLAVEQRKLTRGYHAANLNLQLDEWAYKFYFAGAIIDQETSEKLEYRDLVKRPEKREQWLRSLANELGRLA